MTVSTTHSRNTHTGDGLRVSFDFTFAVDSGASVEPLLNAVEQTSGFTVLPNDDQSINPGGVVLFDVAPAAGVEVELKRRTGRTQDVEFPLEAKLSAPALESALDKMILITQEQQRDLDDRSFVWRGAWDAAKTYGIGDAVTLNGNTYRCIVDGTTSQPPSANWELIAQKGINWRGLWSSATAYSIADAVQYNGSAYYALAANTNSAPPNANWDLIAAAGPSVLGTANQVSAVTSGSTVTIGLASNPVVPGTGGMVPTSGTTAQRGSTAGQFRYNTDLAQHEGYNGTQWLALGPGTLFAGGGDAALGTGTRPLLITPAAPTVTAMGVTGSQVYQYRIVAKDRFGDITAGSAIGQTTVGNAILTTSNFNRITWTAVPGATDYDIYKVSGGSMNNGKIGTTTGTQFDHTGQSGDGTTAPTTSTYVGEHFHNGNWTSSNAFTVTRGRWYVNGDVTVQAGHTVTVSTEAAGGLGAAGIGGQGAMGQGPGGGMGGISSGTGNGVGGGGGGNGGNGGDGLPRTGMTAQAKGGQAYDFMLFLGGSSGGGGACGTTSGARGGDGGGCWLICSTGSISLGESVTATGQAGAASAGGGDGGGGGGAGGTIAAIARGNVTFASGKTFNVSGGAGGGAGSTNAYGGGGGGGKVIGWAGGTCNTGGAMFIVSGGGGSGFPGSNGTTSFISGYKPGMRSAP